MWGVLGIILWVLHLPYGGRMSGLARLWVFVDPFFVSSSAWRDADLERALLENQLMDEYIDADCGHDIDCLMEGIYPIQQIDDVGGGGRIRECALNSVLWGQWFQCDVISHRFRLSIEGGQAVLGKSLKHRESNGSKDVCPKRLEFQLKRSEGEGKELIKTGLFCSAPGKSAYRYVRMVHCWEGICWFTHPATGEQRQITNRFSVWHLNHYMRHTGQTLNVDIFTALPIIRVFEPLVSTPLRDSFTRAIGVRTSENFSVAVPDYAKWGWAQKYYFGYKLVGKWPQVGVFVSDKNETGFGVKLKELPNVQSNYPEFFIRVTDKVSVSAHSVLNWDWHGCEGNFFSVYQSLVYCHPDKVLSITAVHVALLRKVGEIVDECNTQNLPFDSGWISYGVSGKCEKNGTSQYRKELKSQPCLIRTSTEAFRIADSELCFEGFAQALNFDFGGAAWDPNVDELKAFPLKWEPLYFDHRSVSNLTKTYQLHRPGRDTALNFKDHYSRPALLSTRLILGGVPYPVQFFVTDSPIEKGIWAVKFSETGTTVECRPAADASTIYDIYRHANRNTIVYGSANKKPIVDPKISHHAAKQPGPLLRRGESFTTISFGPVAHIFHNVVQVTGFHIILIDTHEMLPFDMKLFANALVHNDFANSHPQNDVALNKYVGVLRPEIACKEFWGESCDDQNYEEFLCAYHSATNFVDQLIRSVRHQAKGLEPQSSYEKLVSDIGEGKKFYEKLSLPYDITTHGIFRDYLRYRFHLDPLVYEDQVAVRHVCEMVALNGITWFVLEHIPNRAKVLSSHYKPSMVAKDMPTLSITHEDFITVALRGIDRLVGSLLIAATDPLHYSVWKQFFPKSPSFDAVKAFVNISSLPIIEEKDFPDLITTLRLMRVLLPPYQTLNKCYFTFPGKKDMKIELQGQTTIMFGMLETLRDAKEECLDSLAYTPMFFKFQENLKNFLFFSRKVEPWELAAYHFTSVQLEFKVTEHEAAKEMKRQTNEPRYHDGVGCIRESFLPAAKLLRLKLLCYIVNRDIRRSLDTSIADCRSRKLQSPSPKWKVRRLPDTSLLQPIIDLHAKALKRYFLYIFEVDPRLVDSVNLHSMSFELKNMLNLSKDSKTFQKFVSNYHTTPDHVDGEVVIEQLQLLTLENGNFASTLNQEIVIKQYIPPDPSHAKNLFSHKPLMLLSLIILIL